VGPDVAIAVHRADGPDLRKQRVANELLLVLLGQEGLEALVLAPRLLELGLDGMELPLRHEPGGPQEADRHDPRGHGREEHRILHLAAQRGEPRPHRLERVSAGAGVLPAGAEIDVDHQTPGPVCGFRRPA
jgi:hypothetical protein